MIGALHLGDLHLRRECVAQEWRSLPTSRVARVGWHPPVRGALLPAAATPTAINVPSIPVVDPSNASPSVASLGTIPWALPLCQLRCPDDRGFLSLFCLLAVSREREEIIHPVIPAPI